MVNATQSGSSSGSSPVKCPSIEEQLAKVKNEIVSFEARKLGELKTELEAVQKKKETAIPQYKKDYEGLKKTWCEQNDHIVSIRRDLIGAFPEWKKYVQDCICSWLAKKRKQENRVKCRSEVKGPREAARDEAKAALDAAKAAATGWESAATTLAAKLAENQKLIDQICKLACSPERPVAIYKLWFKLLSAHACIRPVTDCFTVPVDEMPCELCPPEKPEDCRPCEKYEEQPAPKNGNGEGESHDDDAAQSTPPAKQWPLCDPFLIPPDDYPGRLDCVYDEYLEAKDVYAGAEAYYRAKPDDLAQVKKDLLALANSLDVEIEACLKTKTPTGCCDEEDEGGNGNGSDCDDPCKNQKTSQKRGA
jgi:hypothetical protein